MRLTTTGDVSLNWDSILHASFRLRHLGIGEEYKIGTHPSEICQFPDAGYNCRCAAVPNPLNHEARPELNAIRDRLSRASAVALKWLNLPTLCE